MELVQYISAYREINSIYEKFVESKNIELEDYQKTINLYVDLKQTDSFEEKIFDIINQVNFISFIDAFKDVLLNNITLYNKNNKLFESFDSGLQIEIKCRSFDKEINQKKIKVDLLYKEYRLSKSNLGDKYFSKYNDSKHDSDWEDYLYKKQLYEYEDDELHELFKKRENILYEVLPYVENKFFDINTHTTSLLNILNAYSKGINSFNDEYLTIEILSKVFEFCNGEYFETTTSGNFYSFFNLYNGSKKIGIRNRKKIYICHLIKRLSLLVKPENSKIWRDEILKNLNLLKYFKKKSNQIEYNSNSNNKKAALFIKELDEILKK